MGVTNDSAEEAIPMMTPDQLRDLVAKIVDAVEALPDDFVVTRDPDSQCRLTAADLREAAIAYQTARESLMKVEAERNALRAALRDVVEMVRTCTSTTFQCFGRPKHVLDKAAEILAAHTPLPKNESR